MGSRVGAVFTFPLALGQALSPPAGVCVPPAVPSMVTTTQGVLGGWKGSIARKEDRVQGRPPVVQKSGRCPFKSADTLKVEAPVCQLQKEEARCLV